MYIIYIQTSSGKYSMLTLSSPHAVTSDRQQQALPRDAAIEDMHLRNRYLEDRILCLETQLSREASVSLILRWVCMSALSPLPYFLHFLPFIPSFMFQVSTPTVPQSVFIYSDSTPTVYSMSHPLRVCLYTVTLLPLSIASHIPSECVNIQCVYIQCVYIQCVSIQWLYSHCL